MEISEPVSDTTADSVHSDPPEVGCKGVTSEIQPIIPIPATLDNPQTKILDTQEEEIALTSTTCV